MPTARSHVVSSFTIIKGALIAETYRVFEVWDFDLDRFENLRRMKEENLLGAASANWLRDVAKVINRRFDPAGRDRPLVALAKAGCPRTIWKPLLLCAHDPDEYLVRISCCTGSTPALRRAEACCAQRTSSLSSISPEQGRVVGG